MQPLYKQEIRDVAAVLHDHLAQHPAVGPQVSAVLEALIGAKARRDLMDRRTTEPMDIGYSRGALAALDVLANIEERCRALVKGQS